jgi:hypothetical protein
MKSSLVADGLARRYQSGEVQLRLQQLRQEIDARYAGALAEAGFVRRFILRWRMTVEFRRERWKIVAPHSLYIRH